MAVIALSCSVMNEARVIESGVGMSSETSSHRPGAAGGVHGVRAVLLDALGTLVALEPPAPRLRAALREMGGVDVGAQAAERAFRAEIDHYLAHHLDGGDAPGLDRLRDGCATLIQESLGEHDLDHSVVRSAMLDSLRFAAFHEVKPALCDLRARGLRLVVVSNWDCSLGHWLDRAGLGGLLDGVVSSAVVGQAKPGGAPFRAALELAGVNPAEAVHVGDSLVNDVEGARGAGVRAILVARGGETAPQGVTTARSLAEIASLL